MDNNDQPGNAEIASATQVVDFAKTDEVTQPQNVPASRLSFDPHEQAAQLAAVNIEDKLIAPESSEEGEHSKDHNVQVDPRVSSNELEIEDKGGSFDYQIEQFDTRKPVIIGPHAVEGQSAFHEPQVPDVPGFTGAGLDSGKETPPDVLPSGNKGKGVEKAAPRIVPVIGGEDTELVPSPVDSVVLLPTLLPKKGGSAAALGGYVASAPRKKRAGRKPVGLFEWALGDASRKTLDGSRKTALKGYEQKNDPKPHNQRKDTQKEDQKQDQRKDDLKEPDLGEKAFGKPERTETAKTEKAPVADPWETCGLDIRISDDPNGLTVDIVAIHDLDETKETAWTFVPEAATQKNLKNLKDNDTESRRSRPSLERIRLQLQAKQTMPDTSKKRRGSTKDDATLAFIDGRITVEGRIQRAGEFVTAIAQHGPAKTDPSKADLAPAETDSAKTDPPKTDLPGADPTKTDPTETNPAKNDSALLGQLSSHAGPSNGPPLRDGPEEMETNIAGPSPSRIETRAVASEEGKKENVRPELKRAKSSSKKKKSKFSSSNVIPSTDYPPPVPGAPETTPPKPEQIEAGVDGGVNKEIEESRASERDQRSGRPSTEADGRRAVHLFQEPTMIPGALPGARILSYTYPKLAPTTAHEYVDKAAQKLLESLISARSELPYNTAPIIFIGYGFGGIVLQKLLVLATDAPDEKKAASAQLLDMNAGFVFLNTPFPASKQGDSTDQPSFPSGFNARQEHIMRRLGEDGNKLDVRALWEKFDLKRVIEGQKLPIIWFHTLLAKDSSSASKIQPKRPLPGLAQHAIFCMAMASESNKRALARFSGPKDPLYQRLVGQLRRCLLFKASQRKDLVDLLRVLITLADMNVDVEDEQGRSALHCAASSSNHTAVTVLVRKGEANVLHRDLRGQTPLHAAIQKAAELNPTEKEAQKPFKDIIERLIESAEDIFLTDQKMKTPWYYANELKWIEKLKDNRDMHLGPTTSIGVHSLEPLTRPGTAQLKACENIRGDLVEFYTITKEQKTQERQNAERSYVVDMIYNLGPQTILELARPKLKEKEVRQCRWLHLPANNEQWVHDLFISLRIKDSSLIGQHDGSGHNLHMIAQATKYTQVCEPRYWETKSNDRKTSLDAESPEVAGKATDLKSETIERDAIAIFMPILAYEPSILRKRISKNARRLLRNKEIEEEENNRDILLLKAYLGGTGTKPLHCRRTLDQFSYYMLDSTESRDMDQVLLRWGRKRLEKAGNVGDAPVLMVDQLWLWVLHDGTVITSFPNSWEREEKQPHGLMEKLDEEVKPHGLKRKLDEEIKFNKQRPAIESVDHLVHLIMKLSVDFLRRDAPGGIKFQDAFQSSINNIAEREAKQFKYFKTLTKKLSMKTPTEAQRIVLNGKLDAEKLSEAQRLALTKKLNTRALTEAQRTENIEKLFELNLETHLLVEIKDIQDELNIVSSILGQQKDVLRRLHKLCPTNESAEVDSSEQSKETLDSSVESSADALEHSGDKRKHKGILHHDDESEEASIHEKKKEKKVHFGIPDKDGKNTEKDMPLLKKRGLVDDNLAIVMSNIRIVEDMQHYAETVHTSISNLLDLKQRQANAWEARFSREGSQQSQRQGNIMLVFTLVTIVFLPLSFMSSFFALGVNIFPRDAQSGNVSWPLHTLALLLFGISTLVFVPLVFIALYVNQITSFTKETFQSFFLPGNKITDEAEDKKVEEEEESDEESFKDDDDESTKVAEIDEEHTEVLSEDTIETYAKIFGVWTFHTKIPIVRKLWKWQVYLNTRDDDSEYLDDEGIDMGYPLQHFLDKIPLEKWVPTGLYRWLFRHKDEHSEYSYTDTSYDDSNSTRDRRRSRRFVVEEVRRRDRIDHRRWFGGRGSEGDEVVVIEEDSDRPRFRGSRVISPQRIIRRRSSGSDEVVIIEEYSDDPRSRVRRGVRPVKRMTRLFGRRRADSDDEVEVVEEDSDMPRSRARRVFGTVDRITRLFGRRSADSDDEVEVVEDDSDGPPPRIRRAARPVEEFARRTSRRRSDSSDEIVAIEEDSDRSQFRARRAVRPVRPVERIARKSGRRNSNSDDEVVVIEEDSDMPRSFASRVLAPVEWMFRRRGRETDEEYSDETRTSRGEFSATSGSDRPASVHRGLGAALPEPLKRLFLRRRRVHDIESLVEDD